jgi:succinate dehydrogenase / fumarate reductase flavoprotein subunit
MGGIECDENGATCIDGLYAAGECACVSLHGANRLGGNALPELLVFGARAGRAAADADMPAAEIPTGPSAATGEADVDPPVEPGAVDDDVAADGGTLEESVLSGAVKRERERIDGLLETDGVNHAEVRASVQETITENVNVFRREAALRTALEDLRAARERYRDVGVEDPSSTFNTDLVQTMETRNVLDVAEAIALGALARTEFRGAHWREGYQARDDENWIKHTMTAWNGATPHLYYKPVVLEGHEQTYEPKERSY